MKLKACDTKFLSLFSLFYINCYNLNMKLIKHNNVFIIDPFSSITIKLLLSDKIQTNFTTHYTVNSLKQLAESNCIYCTRARVKYSSKIGRRKRLFYFVYYYNYTRMTFFKKYFLISVLFYNFIFCVNNIEKLYKFDTSGHVEFNLNIYLFIKARYNIGGNFINLIYTISSRCSNIGINQLFSSSFGLL